MTAQIRDKILYKGNQYYLANEPLRPYLEAMEISYPGTSTADYRGYVASWEVRDEKLYLIELLIPGFTPEMGREGDLFQGEERTFSEWFTGKLRIPHGELLEYVHNGYGSLYEKELFLRFLNGELIGESEKDNRSEFDERIALDKQYKVERENRKVVHRIWRFFRFRKFRRVDVAE